MITFPSNKSVIGAGLLVCGGLAFFCAASSDSGHYWLAASVLLLWCYSALILRAFYQQNALLERWQETIRKWKLAKGSELLQLDAQGLDRRQGLVADLNQLLSELHGLKLNSQHFGERWSLAQKLSASVADISSSLNAETQADQQMKNEIEHLTQSIESIAVSARQVRSSSEDSHQLALQSADMAERSAAKVGLIAGQVESLAGIVDRLESRSSQISAVVAVIRDIADQTNLLALNAAIEAARAGEQGRGFAVVADEVRKLAEKTAQATLEISETIASIRSETSKTAEDMHQTVEQVAQGVNLVEDAAASIKRICCNTSTVEESVAGIATATRQQSDICQEISQLIARMQNMMGDTDAAVAHALQLGQALQASGV